MSTPVTQQQRDNLLEALNVMWPSVPKRNVARNLGYWRTGGETHPPDCHTIACFGGWCAWWPTFRAQGVCANWDGRPSLSGCDSANDVSRALFGYDYLFAPRGVTLDVGSNPNGTDHALVTHRLRRLLEMSHVAP